MPIITEGAQTSKKVPKNTQHEAASGIRINAGPFIGIVKNNIDTKRAGRLQVWIAELGGDEKDQTSWRAVSYCTPFYGVTPSLKRGKSQAFDQGSPHSYGMWFVPPDVGIKVLCTFVNGDPLKGYWFGCIPEWPNLHMVPGISSGSWHGAGPEPLVDYNSAADDSTSPEFYKKAQTAHSYQNDIWAKQGLIDDPYRGPGTSSAFRETPSRVFGISTPGPEIAIPNNMDPDAIGNADISIRARQGGHQFVMDDGDANGDSQLVKLRTSNGNMLLLNDSAGIIYLINSAGTAWFEMDGSGNVKVYSQAKIEMHSTGGFVLETPASFNITGAQIDIAATGPVKISGSTVDISGKSGVKVGGEGELHLSGSKSYLSGKNCIGIKGGQHIDLQAGCITLNTKKVTDAKAPSAASPGKGPTHEPYSHINSSTTSPASSVSYAAASGLPSGASGRYGASSSFGATAGVPEYYGAVTNQNGPIKFNSGFQGGFSGQAANNGSLASLNVFDTNSVSYVAVGLNLPTATTGFAVNVKDEKTDLSLLTPGEALNNPGLIKSLSDDPFAIGQNADGLNVYATPEDGIAALSLLLDLIQSDGASTLQDFIRDYVTRKGNTI